MMRLLAFLECCGVSLLVFWELGLSLVGLGCLFWGILPCFRYVKPIYSLLEFVLAIMHGYMYVLFHIISKLATISSINST